MSGPRQQNRKEPVFGNAPARGAAQPRARAARPDARSGAVKRGGGGGPKPPQRGRKHPSKERRPKKKRGFFGFLFYWSFVLMLWGAIGLGGLAIYFSSELPDFAELKIPVRSPNVQLLARDGSLIANRGETGGETVRLEQLPPYLPQAVMAIEDRRFYSHFGVDVPGIARAMIANFQAGRVVQGGSSITQQLAKNLYLGPERDWRRKLKEVPIAIWLEYKFSKDEIMEMYLNRVYLGGGATGVDAAARTYYQKSARYLTLAESAVIAGLLKAPSRLAPNRNPEAAQARAKLVLAAMEDVGYITSSEREFAIANPASATSRHLAGAENYVADWLYDRVKGFLGTIDEDVVVQTTIDGRLQKLAEGALREGLDRDGETYGVTQGAMVSIDPTGAVRALVGGRDYGESQFNRATDARRQPGSSFKPFVYLAAMELGLTPDTVRIDGPVQINGWEPQNYNRKYRGPVTLEQALSLSLNTVAARLGDEVGIDAVAEVANRLGINSDLQRIPSLSLGTSEATPLEMTSAYVPFANGGYSVIEHAIERISTADGDVLYERQSSGNLPVIAPFALGLMNSMMQTTLVSGTATKARLDNRPAGGKTGTSQDFRDAWFIGYTANLVTGIWLGNDDNSPTKRASGGNLPAVIWHDFMQPAHEGIPASPLIGASESREILAQTEASELQPFARSADQIAAQPQRRRNEERGFLQRLFGG